MANRYWVGNAGTWSDTAHWSLTSGGVGGATVPTATENAVFDANSITIAAQTITISATINCLDLDFSAVLNSPTIVRTGFPTLNVYGSLLFTTGMTWSISSLTFNFKSTSIGRLITTASKTLNCNVTFDGVGGEWTVTDTLLCGVNRPITLTRGTLNIVGKSIQCSSFISNNSNTRSLVCREATITIINGGTFWNTETTTGLTIDANELTFIEFSSNVDNLAKYFFGSRTGFSFAFSINWTRNETSAMEVYGSNTFHTLNVSGGSGKTIRFEATKTTTVTSFVCNGDVSNRIIIESVDYDSGLVVNVPAILIKTFGVVTACSYLDIRDSFALGGAIWYAGSTSLNTSDNQGWIFEDLPVVVPTVTTDSVNSIDEDGAVITGTCTFTGIIDRGFVVSTSIDPTISDTEFLVEEDLIHFVATLSSLDRHTLYYVRAFATNYVGTGYGANISFTTAKGFLSKSFYYRVYDATTGVYVTSWTKDVISEPSFRSIINGGSGSLIVRLARTFDDFGEDVDVKLNNKVECYVVDNDDPNGLLIYSGYISGYRPVIQETKEYVEVTAFGYMAEFERMILKDSSGNTTIAYNSYDPSDILKDVIDKARAMGCHITYTATSIQRTNTVVSYTFNTNTVKECLDKVIELTPLGWFWRIDPNNVIYLQNKNVYADHAFSLGLEVENLETYRRIEGLINRVLFIGGGSPPLYRIYENTGSQTSYGLYTKKVVDQRVTVVATAQTISQRLIDAKKDPEIRSIFTIIDNSGPTTRGYDIESVKPGQTLKVKNLKSDVGAITLWDIAFWDVDVWDQTLASSAADVIQILSVGYTPDSINIEASSRLPEIAKRIEDVERNLQNSQTVDNPVAPS